MDKEKAVVGWKCTLSPEEVEYAQHDLILSQYLGKWRMRQDGTASLRVLTVLHESWWIMEMFIEGLGEGMFTTSNVQRIGDVDIVEKEY